MSRTTIADYLARYDLDVLIETGLDHGRGSGMSVRVGRYIALDYQPGNVELARARGFDARYGDSGDLLAGVLEEIDSPALFWLDAHGVDCADEHPVTVEGFPGWQAIPLLREFEAIAAWRHGASSVVLIDDMPAMAEWVGVGLTGEVSALPFYGFLEALPVAWTEEWAEGVYRMTPL